MTPRQTKTIGICARLLRDTYRNQGMTPLDARDKSIRAFRDFLDGVRRPMKKRVKGVGLTLDAVGVVAIALTGAGILKPDQRLAETIFATAENALKEVTL